MFHLVSIGCHRVPSGVPRGVVLGLVRVGLVRTTVASVVVLLRIRRTGSRQARATAQSSHHQLLSKEWEGLSLLVQRRVPGGRCLLSDVLVLVTKFHQTIIVCPVEHQPFRVREREELRIRFTLLVWQFRSACLLSSFWPCKEITRSSRQTSLMFPTRRSTYRVKSRYTSFIAMNYGSNPDRSISDMIDGCIWRFGKIPFPAQVSDR